MNGIVININPVIFHLGAFELRWYGLAIILAIVAAVLITAHLGKKKGIATGKIYSLGRFVLTFVRQENQFFWGLQQAQIIALLTLVISLIAMIYFTKVRRMPEKIT